MPWEQALGDDAGQQVHQVLVLPGGARRELGLQVAQALNQRSAVERAVEPERVVARQAAAVAQQVACAKQSLRLRVVQAQFGQHVAQRCVEVEAAVLRQAQQQHGAEGLAAGGQREQRGRSGRCGAFEIAVAAYRRPASAVGGAGHRCERRHLPGRERRFELAFEAIEGGNQGHPGRRRKWLRAACYGHIVALATIKSLLQLLSWQPTRRTT
jgi:hypothetical protein